MNIIFFGTPEFAAHALTEIVGSAHKILAAVTAPDKSKGRGGRILPSAVKEAAENLGIPVLQPTYLKSEDFLSQLQSYHADIFVVVAFRMLPTAVFSMPPKGTFNLHASLLPQYRGAAPINYAILNGEKETGVTTFFINEKIDEGNILLQDTIEIKDSDNAGSLHDKLKILGASLIIKTLNAIENDELQSKPQAESKNALKLAKKIQKEDLLIDWNQSIQRIHNHIRAFSPYPASFTKFEIDGISKTIKILSSKIVNDEDAPNLDIQELKVIKKQLFVGCKDGILEILELQPENKKPMKEQDFINGLKAPELIKLSGY